MATTYSTMQPKPRDRFTSKLQGYYILTKPEVNLLILMTTSAGYYLASRGPFRIAGLINTLVGTLLVRNPESVDGTGLGRSDAPHGQPTVAFGQAGCSRSISVWDCAEHRRGPVSCHCG